MKPGIDLFLKSIWNSFDIEFDMMIFDNIFELFDILSLIVDIFGDVL